ncbi:sulfatase-like hydrolase/transferase [Colwellia piezophila]|uniref:sulfatase-like hydrolase/transferase n=1 Tax=Colwellia piezophila TaxID=211668 RepID=UPI000369AC6D|nr:sulfatase-like hydrolase/transferase [Colwellia piezophila]
MSKKLLVSLSLIMLASLQATANDSDLVKHSEKPQNVLLIMVDDLNDYQGVFGGHPQVKTPNIDKLASQSIRFTNMQTNTPVCQPSRNSLFTGVYPHDSADFGWTAKYKQPVLKHNKTIMELFNENGYFTLGTGKLMHGNKTPEWQEWGNEVRHNYGPTLFDGKKLTATKNVPAPFRDIGAIDGSFGRLSEGGVSVGKKGEAGWVMGWTKAPFRYLNENDRDLLPDEAHAKWASEKFAELANKKAKQPFFMGVGFVRPHTPLYAPDRFFDMYPLESITLAPWMKNDVDDTHFNENFPENGKGLKYYRTLVASYDGDREKAMKVFLQAYLACITFMDEQVGKVIDALASHPSLNNNTMIVFTSDHGWQMGEKNYLFKNSPWEESARIPLLIRPAIGPVISSANDKVTNTTVEHPVSLIDIFPTLVDYANLKGDHRKNKKGGKLGGFSLRPFIEDPTTQNWPGPNGALTVVGNYANSGKEKHVAKQNYSYRTKQWRYIHYSNGAQELYNHDDDPHEWNNIAAHKQNQLIVKQLKNEISAIIGQDL